MFSCGSVSPESSSGNKIKLTVATSPHILQSISFTLLSLDHSSQILSRVMCRHATGCIHNFHLARCCTIPSHYRRRPKRAADRAQPPRDGAGGRWCGALRPLRRRRPLRNDGLLRYESWMLVSDRTCSPDGDTAGVARQAGF